jgi:hypothetical protein
VTTDGPDDLLSSGFVLSLSACSKFLDSEFKFSFLCQCSSTPDDIQKSDFFQCNSTSDDKKGDGNIGGASKMGT